MARSARFLLAAVTVSAVALGSTIVATAAPSRSQSTQQVTFALGGIGVYDAALYVAKIEGYFKKQNIDANLQVVFGNAIPLMVGGRADFAVIGAGSAMSPANQGAPTTLVYNLSNYRISGFLAGAAAVKTAADCKRIVTSGVGSSSQVWAAVYKSEFNLKADIVPIADVPTQVATVASGQADCISSAMDTYAPLVLNKTVHFVIDPRVLSQLPPDTVPNGVGVSLIGLTPNLQSKSDAIVKSIFAVRQACALMKRLTPQKLASLLRFSPDWAAQNQTTVVAELQAEKGFACPNSGVISPNGWPGMIKYFSKSLRFVNNSDSRWFWSNRVDMSYWKSANVKYRAFLASKAKKKK